MAHLGITSILIVLFAVTPPIKTIQDQEQPRLSGYAIEITNQSGQSTHFLIAGRELKGAGSFTLPSTEIIKRADNDSEQVSMITVAASSEKDAWRIKVSVVKGDFYDKGEQDVATYLVRESEKVTVKEMGQFGTKSFDIAVVRINQSGAIQPSKVFGQSLDARLGQRLTKYESEKTTPLEQLIELAQQFQIPMGIEWVDDSDDALTRSVNLRGTTPKDVMAQILAQKQGYTFTVEEGVVHISQISLAHDPRNFLNISFPQYTVQKASLREADYWLGVSLKRFLHPERNMGGGFGGSRLEADFDVPMISFSGSDLTVRQILNKLVLAHGKSLWVVHLNSQLLMEGEPFYASGTSSDGKVHQTSFGIWCL